MKHLISFAIAGLFLMIFSSCRKVTGEGPVLTQTRVTPNFTAIASGISSDVFVKQGNTLKVEIQAQQNILDIIETRVINNELEIKFRNGVHVRSHEHILVNIIAPEIDGLRLSGSGNITTLDNITTNGMNLRISGSGNIRLPQLTANTLEATVSGSGNIAVLNGAVGTATLKISGSGNIDLLNVPAGSAFTTTSGSGSIKVNLSQNLQVNISGSGSVYYRGNPTVNTSISGSGNVIHIF